MQKPYHPLWKNSCCCLLSYLKKRGLLLLCLCWCIICIWAALHGAGQQRELTLPTQTLKSSCSVIAHRLKILIAHLLCSKKDIEAQWSSSGRILLSTKGLHNICATVQLRQYVRWIRMQLIPFLQLQCTKLNHFCFLIVYSYSDPLISQSIYSLHSPVQCIDILQSLHG
jgi:hypothetical protein